VPPGQRRSTTAGVVRFGPTTGWQSVRVQRWNDVEDVPAELTSSVVAIGNFDGVHRGHRAVLRGLVEVARQRGCLSVAITFDPHPVRVLRPDAAPAPLTTLEHRVELMASTGLDAVLVLPFTRELATWPPARFVDDVLIGRLHVTAVVVGRDIRFGHRNSGDIETMRSLGAERGFDVLVVEDVGDDAEGSGDDVAPEAHATGRWSSTWLRRVIAEGDVEAAARVLARPHRVTATVVHGDHRGRELGYPTANLGPDAVGVIPADGVYAGWLERVDDPPGAHDRRLPAAISVGTNPTFDGRDRRVEAYVLDRDDLDLYGRRVAVEFEVRLRPTLKFDGIDPLLVQMAEDVERTRLVLGAGRGAEQHDS
jgi:riboflavin kinase/FMN adenylyltransferase